MIALIAKLIEAGTPADLVAEVAMELGKAQAERTILAARRESERNRKARSRAVTGQDVTACDSADKLPLSPPSPKDPQTPKEPQPPLTPTGRDTARTRKGDFPRPDFADPQHWADLLANRARKRLPNTASAHAKLMRDIEKYTDEDWPPGRIIQHAAEKGWAGIYDPRENQEKRNGHRPANDRQYPGKPCGWLEPVDGTGGVG